MKPPQRKFIAVLWLLAIFVPVCLPAAETIDAFETLPASAGQQLRLLDRDTRNKIRQMNQSVEFSFIAFGRRWHWQIRPNTRLLAPLPVAQRVALLQDVSLWQGHDPVNPEHWLRFSLWRDRHTGQTSIQGMWWDGNDYYVIRPASRTPLPQRLKTAMNGNVTVIYRLSDVRSDQPLVCGVDESADPNHGFEVLAEKIRSHLKTGQDTTGTIQQLSVAIVADTFYQALWGANTNASILSLMNTVDGIYSNQIGVAVVVSAIHVINDNGGMTATDSGLLLEQFRDWVGAGNITNPGLAHLFTSRNLDGNIKGRAWLNVLCAGRWGTGIDEVVGNSYEPIVVAHEMGHNFGADHDGDANGSCPAEPINTYVMSPSVSASYTSFSPCSANILINNAATAACIVPVTDLIFAHGFE